MEYHVFSVRKRSCFELFRDRKYGIFWSKKLMESWYFLGIFELFIIFQDLGNMVFRAVFGGVCVFFYQLFGYPKTNFGLLKRRQPYLTNVDHWTLYFEMKVTGNLWTKHRGGIWTGHLLILQLTCYSILLLSLPGGWSVSLGKFVSCSACGDKWFSRNWGTYVKMNTIILQLGHRCSWYYFGSHQGFP